MGGSWKEVVQVLMVGITIQVVGSIVALLLWNSVVKCLHCRTATSLPRLSAVGGSADQPVTKADVEMETLDSAEVVTEAVVTIPSPADAADPVPTCQRT